MPKAPKKKRKLPKTVQESIPYEHVYENGMIETEPGTFTKTYRLEDVNFKIAPDEEQVSIFKAYGTFLNTFSFDTPFQVVIHNHNADKREVFNDIKFDFQKDELNRIRTEMNNDLLEKLSEGRNNLAQDKYLTVSIQEDSVDKAVKRFRSLDAEISRSARRLAKDYQIETLGMEERLRILHDIYNQVDGGPFNNDENDAGSFWNLDKALSGGMTTKDMVGPAGFEFKSNYFKTGETFGRSMYLENVPSWLSTEFISDIADINTNMLISLNYQPIQTERAMKLVKNQIMNIEGQMAATQKRAIQEGFSYELGSTELTRSKKQAVSLLEDIVNRDQRVYFVTLVITVFADSLDRLKALTGLVESVATNYLCPVKTLLFQQEAGLNASLPLACNKLYAKRMCTTETASVFIPFTSQELHQKNGIPYGKNQTTGNIIMYARQSGGNYNGLFIGESGGGKSAQAKLEMMSALLRSDKNRVYVIDPENEYSELAHQLHGDVVELSASTKNYVNPLDMDIDYDGDGNPIFTKTNYVISMVETMLGGGQLLDAKAKSVLGRSVGNIYRGYLQHMDEVREKDPRITCDKDASPTLLNLYQDLLNQPEEEAETVAKIIEIYAKGAMSTFAHRTNIETNARFCAFNTLNLGTGMKELGIHICLNDIWNRMIENSKKGLWTWVYVDEMQVLLKQETMAAFLSDFWTRARKWNGVITGITQNTENLLTSASVRKIMTNTKFMLLTGMSKLDRTNIGDLLQIPESQLAYITNPQPGTGLLYTGKTTLPFNNIYPKESPIYKIISTSRTRDIGGY